VHLSMNFELRCGFVMDTIIYDACDGYCDIYDACCDIYDACDEYCEFVIYMSCLCFLEFLDVKNRKKIKNIRSICRAPWGRRTTN
jgi:hypothetical protein